MSFSNFKIKEKSLKKSIVIPLIILAFALFFIIQSYLATGTVFDRGIDLEGGTQITVHYAEKINLETTEAALRDSLGTQDIVVVTTTNPATRAQETVIVTVGGEHSEESIISAIRSHLKINLAPTEYSISTIGPALAESFWHQARWAFAFAFLFMAGVVALYYKKFLPSLAIVISTVYDLTIIIGFMAFLKIPLTLATIAGLLMIIGYGVDTNILLTNKVIKEREGELYDRLSQGMRTGLTMSATTIAVLLALFFVGGAYSLVLRQISLILLIGLLADIPNTWCLNANILTWKK